MNKHCYRIIFNKARGMLMAVAETVLSGGKAAGTTSRSMAVPGSVKRGTVLVSLRALTFGVWSALGMVMWPAAAQAQIVADPNAPSGQRPTILNAANGVPQVNIQTPSAAGVSRNTYTQFDVQQQGAILNNARTNAQTELGGWIQGNPWLAAGTARVILNEVNSSNPSLLHGYVEVAGNRAQVIIANPAGVACNGCGFINANRATLTTGTPIVNGGNLDGYRVQGGAITITGAGLDASRTDYTELIARSVQVNAGIWASQLKVMAGAGQVSVDANGESAQATAIAGGGGAPAFAIDVAQLGGMYAGKIILVGTDAGVGVRNAGEIGASAGEVIVTANGRLENAGRISSAGNTHVDAGGGIQNSGTLYAQGDASLGTRGDIDNSGVIAAQGDTSLAAAGANSRIASINGAVLGAGIRADGSLGASGALVVNATRSVTAQGQNLSGGDQSLSAQAIDIAGSQTSARTLGMSAGTGDIDATAATISIDDALILNAAQTLRTDGALLAARQITVSAHDISNVRGEIVHTGLADLSFNLPGTFDNTQGRIAANSQNLSIVASTLTNTDGMIEHAGSGRIALDAASLNSERGQISSNGVLDIKAIDARLDDGDTVARQLAIDTARLSNQRGLIVQTGSEAASVKASTLLDNTGGTIMSNASMTLAVGALANRGGVIQASGSDTVNLDIDATGLIDNGMHDGAAGRIGASGSAAIDASGLDNRHGQIIAGQALSVSASGAVLNQQGLLAANSNISVSAGRIDNTQGTIGSVWAQANISAIAGALDNTGGRVEAAHNVNVSSAGLTNVDGTIAGGSLAINSQAQTLDNTRGRLAATGASDSGALDIHSGALNNDSGAIQAQGDVVIDTQGSILRNTNAGDSGGILAQGSITLATGDIDNRAGYFGSAGNFTAESAAITNTEGGVLASVGHMQVNGSALDNRGGQIQALGNIEVDLGSGALNNTASLVRSGQTLNISAGSIVNADTQGYARGLEGQTVILRAGQINNRNGAIRADDTLELRLR